MNNYIKKKINLNLVNIRKIPITILFLFIFGILFSINGLFENNYVSNIIDFFCILFCLIITNTLFTEVLFTEKTKRIVCYILSIILAVILSFAGFSSLLFEAKKSFIHISDRTLYLTICYIISILSSSIFIIYRKEKLNFFEYCNIILNNLFKTILIYVIGLICLLFFFILLDITMDVNYKIKDLVYSLLFGLYLLPNIVLSFINTNSKINSLYKVIGLFCILPLTIISIFIIYFYIVKLLITKDLPNNLIFILVLFVFVFGIISYFVIKNINNKFTKKFCIIFPYIFVLPVILQSYSLFIRISEYGLTPDRYISYMIIVFELIMLFLLIYKRGIKLKNILISIIIICIIINVGPFNFIRLSNISQQNILNKNYNKEGEYYYKAVSAYKYLINSEDGKKYISTDINKKLEEEILNKTCTTSYKSYYLSNKFLEIDVSKYKNLKEIDFSYANGIDDLKNINILNKNKKSNIEATINLSEYIGYLMSNNYLTDEEFKQNNIIKIDDNTIIYLDYIYFRVNKQDKTNINYSRGTGYLLER